MLEILSFILSAYLAFAGYLADGIASLMVSGQERLAVTEEADHTLSILPSKYEFGGAIPDILIRNSQFQQATVLGAVPAVTSTSSSVTDALVNIYCTYTTAENTRTTTGSGFFINKDGVILTNAHVAQFLLLEDARNDGESECVVRTGSPAEATYIADLLYISPAWIVQNAQYIDAEAVRATGERDYALLYVTRGIDNRPLPARVPHIAANTALVTDDLPGEAVTLGGYPVTSGLSPDGGLIIPAAIASSSVTELFTFGSNYIDVLALAGSSVGTHGVSGGPVISEAGEAIGLIVTKGNDVRQGAGSLNAITLSYINRTIEEETGSDFAAITSGNLVLRSRLFTQTVAPLFSERLSDELD